MQAWDLLIDRADLSSTELRAAPTPRPDADQAVLRVARVGLTTNNLTYVALGDALRYWDFFPTDTAGTGHIPLWGYADVLESRSDALTVGERVFGYLPSASHLVVTPDPVTAGRFRDAAAHRADLMPIYNDYSIVSGDLSPDAENLDALYRPLFMTSFAFEQFLADNAWFGAGRLLISSASSKTAYGVALLARHRGAGVEIVGITSPRNVSFTESLGCYDRVVTYADVTSLPLTATVYADVAGDPELRRQLHHRLGDQLAHDAVLGASHLNGPTSVAAGGDELPGVGPTLFAAFDHLRTPAMRHELTHRYPAAWDHLREVVSTHLDVVVGDGADELRDAWARVQRGDTDPRQGLVITFGADS